MYKLVLIMLAPFLALSLHAATKRPVVVAVIDTGYTKYENVPLCDPPFIARVNSKLVHTSVAGIKDIAPRHHGSNVVGLIAKYAGSEGYCFIIFKVFKKVGPVLKFDYPAYIGSLGYISDLKPDFLNLSMQGRDSLESEIRLLKRILSNGTTVLAASGNDGLDLNKLGCIIYPACTDPRIIVVANSEGGSNLGRAVDVFENGTNQTAGGFTLTGSSQATAVHTGKLVRQAVEARSVSEK